MKIKKKYDKEVDQIERLECKIRDLKEVNRDLERKIKKINKGYRKYREEKEERFIEKLTIEPEKKICYDCGVGELIRIEFANRYFRKCNYCDKRTKTKDIK